MIDEKFVILAAALIVLGDFSYLVYTIKGKVKPNRVTWLLWGFPALITSAVQFSQGLGILSLATFAFGIPCFLIFFASFLNKKAYWKITTFDLTCGAVSLIGLALWSITQVGNWAILLAVVSDGLASVPTIVKSYKAPETENYQAYLLNGLGAIVILFTIKQWEFAYSAFPVYILLLNLILVPLVKFKLGKKIQAYA
ncbi:MAG: hypothetical protein Q7R82_00595 [Candidatus Daviesbacteria bacterium]|nr:hypothetical protein [Candidatus Daviesbacteria bacterium]